MSLLPLLEKNAYLTILIKDNGLWSHLAYVDYNASREYILSDFTDLTPLRHRLDDDTFSKSFWFQYFDNLEKVFGWDIVDENKNSVFTFKDFVGEGEGVSGIKIIVDDNQRFFDKIFASVRSFSRDVALRVVDDLHVQKVLEGIVKKSEYDDIIYLDMDLLDYSLFRVQKIYDRKGKEEKLIFNKAKINWKSDSAVIDTVNDSRFSAFLATDISQDELLDYWSNFVLNRVLSSDDPNIVDILRAFSTAQNHSILRDNAEKIEDFAQNGSESAMIVSGYIPRILGKSKTLLSVIDGLELADIFDCYWDLDMKILSYGASYAKGTKASDIILTRKDIFSDLTRIVIPTSKNNKNEGVAFKGTAESIHMAKTEFFALASEYSLISFPEHSEKLVVEGQFAPGFMNYMGKLRELSFVSIPDSKKYDSLLIDTRPRPIVYGPDSYSNKLKLQKWINDSKT